MSQEQGFDSCMHLNELKQLFSQFIDPDDHGLKQYHNFVIMHRMNHSCSMIYSSRNLNKI